MKPVAIVILSVLIAGSLPVASFGQTASDQRDESKHARFPGSRTTLQGEVWLTWDSPVREWFAEAALAGYKVGYDEGCSDASASRNSSQTSDKQKRDAELCPNARRFRNQGLSYAKQMTDFYTQYPGDRDLPLAYLIQMLIGPKPKTLDEIHRWVDSIDQ